MSDDAPVGPQAQDAVRLAILAAGDPLADDWDDRVQAVLPKFAALVREDYGWWGQEAQGVIDASVFSAKYESHSLEETSKRIVVTIETRPSKNYPDGREPIRTAPMYTPAGRAMRERLDELSPGDEIVIWKKIETSSEGDRKFRVLVHFERARNKTQEQRASSPSPAPARPPADEAPPRAPSRAPSAGGHSDTIATQMAELTNPQKIAVRKQCVAAGVDNFMDPQTTDDLDKVLVIIQTIRKE